MNFNRCISIGEFQPSPGEFQPPPGEFQPPPGEFQPSPGKVSTPNRWFVYSQPIPCDFQPLLSYMACHRLDWAIVEDQLVAKVKQFLFATTLFLQCADKRKPNSIFRQHEQCCSRPGSPNYGPRSGCGP